MAINPNQNDTRADQRSGNHNNVGARSSITGTFSGQKPPLVNGIAVLTRDAVQSFTAAAQQGTPSTQVPIHKAVHLVGDLTNGIVVADEKEIQYLTGVGVNGALWNKLAPPKGMTRIVAMCGDLANGLVVTDGTEIHAWTFSGSAANEWVPLAQLPSSSATVSDLGGDPTNGVLLALKSQTGGPSTLYFGGSGCACSWVPVTSTGTSLPSARVAVKTISGNYTNGFILLGENQLFTLSGLKYTAGSSTAPGSCTGTLTKIASAPPFPVTDLTGDPANGITARCGDVLIATTATPFTSWVVVNGALPDHGKAGAAPGVGTPAPAEPVAQAA